MEPPDCLQGTTHHRADSGLESKPDESTNYLTPVLSWYIPVVYSSKKEFWLFINIQKYRDSFSFFQIFDNNHSPPPPALNPYLKKREKLEVSNFSLF